MVLIAKQPLLSICIPAYNRPEWLWRNITSIIDGNDDYSKQLEIIITDDSTSLECQEVASALLDRWPGQWNYINNPTRLGMVKNWNYSLELATGNYVLILHDDDFLLQNGLAIILKTIQANPVYSLFLFGVHLVTDQEKLMRVQAPRSEHYLSPQLAIYQLLNQSSFVRFPGLVIQRQLFQDYGYFAEEFGPATDIAMWLKLMSHRGVYCVPRATAAYRIHPQALTMGMFKVQTLQQLRAIFNQARATNLLTPAQLNQAEANFLHQFILAGTIRLIKQHQWATAEEIFNLFSTQVMEGVGYSLKWCGLRWGLGMFWQVWQLWQWLRGHL
ncbi:glycosyltransferase family 2 protein [Thermosynechococcaceae cyanobacterium BACA0444]|uniref:Glycosyltransferase family 2 protein n=1 Tax=Pseudocalidococcus azoricus BACA0444 TaxID=2918990 RepID=A0AAE4FRX8_9CYAN|nr:glycosyltransferase family 2 protein [Pseudocalidococcus azoricus]MDS3859806.1 glycosyltransferase family 2 protein [Pseudocalidococcus azoricus BACA0444]